MNIMIASRTRTLANNSCKSLRLFTKNILEKRNMNQISTTKMEFSSQFMVVGLGNHSMPHTRHSVGMATVDILCRHLKGTWSKDRDCMGDIAIATVDGHHRLILLKPRLLMNINGRSIIKTARKYQIASSNVYLIHDDLDRAFGKHSIKESEAQEGPKSQLAVSEDRELITAVLFSGHNGVRSSICALGTDVMTRLRIGIGRPTNRNAVTDYVLNGFNMLEKERLPQILDESVLNLLDHIIKRTAKT